MCVHKACYYLLLQIASSIDDFIHLFFSCQTRTTNISNSTTESLHYALNTSLSISTIRPKQVPVGVEIAGCLVEAQGCSQCGCLLGTGTARQSYPGYNERKIHVIVGLLATNVTDALRYSQPILRFS